MWLLLCCTAGHLSARNQRDTLGVGQPVSFEENLGQWEHNIKFKAQMRGAALFAEQKCFTIVVHDPVLHPFASHRAKLETERFRSHAYRLHFVGASAVSPTGYDPQPGYSNYYIGDDPARWASHVTAYASVYYAGLYDGVDMKVYSATNALKYDFVVAPGADPSQIVMQYEGLNKIVLQGGNLVLHTIVSDVVELKPYAYQVVNNQQVEVASHYVLRGNTVSIAVGEYDHTRPLVIDPYLHFSTYTGSTADNWGSTSAYDSYKQTYTSGLVFDTGYPTSLGAYDSTYNGNADVGIFKFDTSGTQRLYATYLGGTNADMPHSMFVNAFDELVIFGTTGSPNFPTTPGAYQTTFRGGHPIYYESNTINYPTGVDIFVCRFNADGTQLQASTLVGGSGNDGLNYRQYYNISNGVVMLGNDSLYFNYGDGARGELIADDLNNIYVGTTTHSSDFPTTPGAFQPNNGGGQDGVVFKLDYNLQHLLWSSYLGGSGNDAIYSVDTDDEYNLLVCGGTTSTNFPTTARAHRTTYAGGSADGFVSKISYYGNQLMASSLYGSSAYDQCYFVRTGKRNHAFIFGQTKASGSTLVYNANYNTPNSGQFLARFTANLDTLVWSTVFGTGSGEPNISPTAFSADICNRVYAVGWGRKFCGYYLNGQTIPWNSTGTWGMQVTADALQSTSDGQDFYIMSIDESASALTYATFYGESHNAQQYNGNDHVDGGTSRFDRCATLYEAVCASCGAYSNFPTTVGSWSRQNRSNNCNNALFRITIADDFPVAEFVPPPAGCAPYNIHFHNTGRGTSYLWDFGDGSTSTEANPSHTYAQAGSYTVRLIARIPIGCRTADTLEQNVMVLGSHSQHLDTLTTCPGLNLPIGIKPQLGASYEWITPGVSDSTIANPSVSAPGHYILLVRSNTCTDTIHQVVTAGRASFHIVGDTETCSSPVRLDVNVEHGGSRYVWSSSPLLTDTLNGDTRIPVANIPIDTTRWIYVMVQDLQGCTALDSIHIHFQGLMDSLIITDETCPSACNGKVAIGLTTGAVPPLLHNWGNGWSSKKHCDSLCPGRYTLTTQDSRGCSTTRTFTIAQAPSPTFSHDLTHVLCLESCTGLIALHIAGDAVPYQVTWLDDNSHDTLRTGLCPGRYVAQVTDANGCTYYDTSVIVENADMNVRATLGRITCPEECNGSATALASGGVPPYAYQWSNGATTATCDHLCEGTAIITATDSKGCQVLDSIVIARQHSFDSIRVWADDERLFDGESTTLHVTPIPQGRYAWTPIAPLSGASSHSPTATLHDSTTFTVVVTDSLGCTYRDSLLIPCITVACGESDIFIPNIFTPNGDGVNDQLCVRGSWVKEFHMAIFTRWGELMYESKDLSRCWDGRHNGNMCQPGVYTYICDITCEGNKKTRIKGDITLVR